MAMPVVTVPPDRTSPITVVDLDRFPSMPSSSNEGRSRGLRVIQVIDRDEWMEGIEEIAEEDAELLDRLAD